MSIIASFLFVVFAINVANAGPKYAGIVMDAKTGKILYSHKANDARYPASLTKMMTLYLMFEALDQGKITKKTRIRMSKYAASKPPSKLGVKAGRTLSAEQAILSLVTKSANDVATAVAEHLGGSESNFAARMTKRARQLGMRKTTFRNASGLTAKGQLTTAKDMAILGLALREHYPKHYRYFSTRLFKYRKRKYGNHNRLLGRVKGVDGIKTGYTQASGFNLVSSVRHKKRSIVAVVMGGKSGKSRNAQMQKLISKYLNKATRRSKKKMLVASINKQVATTQLASVVQLPKQGPMPIFRQQVDDPALLRIEQAHVASITFANNKRRLSKRSFNVIRNKLLSMNNTQSPSPKHNSKSSIDNLITASVETKTPVTSVSRVNKSVIQFKSSGWQVQVGAVPDQTNALLLLSKTRQRMPSLDNARKFGEIHDYLEPVVKNGTTLYRARFAGFESKKSARSACKAMKTQKIACLALKG
ncbi:MAG: D-alanyl-D-alanine carboxypeptidase [Hyphomicrobiales bacterium]|nr:D-alanyl-D-alanine carboxypeptidase [Hyphomicrobiales bacterium]